MPTKLALRGTAAAVMLLSSATFAAAQSSGPPAASAPPPAASAPSPGAGAIAARVEAHIRQLHAQLKITPAEEATWKEFADAMRDNARDMDAAAAERAAKFASMSAVEDLQSYEKLAEAHVEHLQKLIPAFTALYDSMPPDQKQVADQVFRARAEHRAQTDRGHGR